MVDLERARRLVTARQAAGFARPRDAIARFGWHKSTYHGHENGSRGISRDRIALYAEVFRVAYDWLASGRGAMRAGPRRIRIEGYVNNNATIWGEEHTAEQAIDEIELPQGMNPEEFSAFRVRGNSTYPVWRDGDVILAARRHGPPEDHIGKLCVITLGDRTRLIRTLMNGGRAGLFLLLSHAAPPMIDIEVVDAAPIEWTKHAG